MQHRLHGLAENPALPPDLLERLIAAADEELACTLAGRPDLTSAQLADLAEFDDAAVRLAYDGRLTAEGIDPAARPRVALALLDAGVGRPEWGRLLAGDPVARHREQLAACPDLPPDVLRALASDPEIGVVAELALWAPTDLAAELATHPHAEVRRSVAANEKAPPAALTALLTGEGLPAARSCLVCDRETIPFVHAPDCDRRGCDLPPDAACDGSHQSTRHQLQQIALQNPATPAEAAAGFARHPSMLLRVALAARADLAPQTAARLAEDAIPWVRATLASNPVIGEDVIRALAADRGHDVQRQLAHHPNLPLEVLDHLAGATRIGSTLLPRIATASRDEVEHLAASRNPEVRMLVAHRRDLPAAVRDALAEDCDAKVAKAIAPHPGLTDAQLRTMLARHGVRVVAKVAANPDATAMLLEDLAEHRPPVQKAFREIARHPHATATALLPCLADSQARPLAARHPELPPEVIVELLDDEDWQVVEAAAANPSLPRSVMTSLTP
ncbi:hypothetical protein KDL01_02275 [Actinospica durhamensis]|uniref:Leucine rich repeat variant n=1 Tax=Actinospica durhamensis TaxID=1508375 RepID=A0A941IKP0_9ACTN|nr:hypothetical protein [Actinospica durhamensis]MBR7832065.1 hypothetical protein [Actinospica durhamensis]